MLLVMAILVLSCKKQETTGYSITAEAKGFKDGTIVELNALSASNRPSIIDSTTIKDGKFSFTLSKPESIDFNYLTFKGVSSNVLFLAEDAPLTMTVYKDSLRSSIIQGGQENPIFYKYIKDINSINKQKNDLRNQMVVANRLKEQEKINLLSQQQNDLKEKEKTMRTDIAEKHPNSLVSIIALSDLMNLKLTPARQVKEMYAEVDDTLKTTRLGKNLDRLIASFIGRVDIGSEAENFKAPTPDGKMLSLKESMGKITIIDFWASWCKPCRVENPNVVRVYNKYHDKGLNIIGVSLDRNKEQWMKAIDQDQLNWNHVSNLKFWQEPIAKSYGVRSIPATFIIDEKGNVIAKNLRGPALENRIAELLGVSEETL